MKKKLMLTFGIVFLILAFISYGIALHVFSLSGDGYIVPMVFCIIGYTCFVTSLVFLILAIWLKEDSKENKKDEKSKLLELKKYKELLDSGILTQEEFDRKKSELLNF